MSDLKEIVLADVCAAIAKGYDGAVADMAAIRPELETLTVTMVTEGNAAVIEPLDISMRIIAACIDRGFSPEAAHRMMATGLLTAACIVIRKMKVDTGKPFEPGRMALATYDVASMVEHLKPYTVGPDNV